MTSIIPPPRKSNISAVGTIERKDITIDVSDKPGPDELNVRVATLFNQVFSPEPAVLASQVSLNQMNDALTNYVYMATIDPAPILPAEQVPRILRNTTTEKKHQGTIQLPRTYLLRVYGAGVDEILSREKELFWLNKLTSLGFGSQMYVIFGNGRIEEFLESTMLASDDIRHASTSRLIAQGMSELHTLVSHYWPFGGSDGKQSGKEAEYCNGQPEIWAKVDAWMRLLQRKLPELRHKRAGNAKCAEILDNWPKVEQAVRKFKIHIEQNACSPVVFAHNDMTHSNILRLKRTGELVIVDFEYGGHNYRGFDIANHFYTWMSTYHPSSCEYLLDPALYPTVEQRRGFLQAYIRTKALIDANIMAGASATKSDLVQPVGELHTIDINEDQIRNEVEALDREVAFFAPASQLHWGVWGLLQVCSGKADLDFASYSAQRLETFLNYVAEIK
ncbi:hypothetical protein IW140_004710 [Coemansia sp. RSA 1813]|nr:hypothetical protein EV178_005395 [Coemansia sp. RSA 1646]KAJ1770397.1 hypothetical protein LPJ74_003204 [Coemansia sp. RSA 1843]KAJ2088213.1 hypothetical protein IW138_004385 [Coemansia sp. RSA 986]KAJ2215744.1 hypothetical protein EV179_001968 [Coemansia sp. RSA 487]KAJ2566919.1 hypothetical protein IW140_004710 [Coemansia sp. RSA 1813]